MKHLLSTILFCGIGSVCFAQYLFPKKYDDCPAQHFCWDCGDQKVTVDSTLFKAMLTDLNHRVYVNNLKGNVIMQVLVDSAGNSCVLSHSETKGLTVTEKMVWAIHDFKGWKPAITQGKPEPKVCILVQFLIDEGKISAQLIRITKEMRDEIEKKSIQH